MLACGVCRTDLHLLEGDLPEPNLPVIPGHEAVAVAEAVGAGVEHIRPGQRFGVPWLGWTCGKCRYCRAGQENLCDSAEFTGYHRHGGFAEKILAEARYCVPIPDGYSPEHAAPLLCAGLIGYRTWKLAGPSERLGIYGFGAAAHIVAQVAVAAGPGSLCICSPRGSQGRGFRPGAWCDMGRGVGSTAAQGTGRGADLRTGGRAGPHGAGGGSQGRLGGVRRDPHERHSQRFPTNCCGVNGCCVRWQTLRATTLRISCRWRKLRRSARI